MTVLAYLVVAVAGFVVGVIGSFGQAVTVGLGPVPLPVGLVGVLAATGAVFYAGGRLDPRPIGVGLPALAWFIGVFPFSIRRPEGDIVLSGDLRSYAYLVFGALLAVVAAAVAGPRDQTPGMIPTGLGVLSAAPDGRDDHKTIEPGRAT